MINGNVHYSNDNFSREMNQYKNSDLDVISSGGVNLGYFLSNNFAIGVSGSVNNYNSTHNAHDLNYSFEHTSNFAQKACGIFARYNHTLKSGKLGFFLQLGTQYIWGDEHITDIQKDPSWPYLVTYKDFAKHNGALVILNPGLIYFINKKFSVESSLGSIYSSSDKAKSSINPINEKTTKFSADLYLTSINLGFTYYFGGKKV